MDTTNIILAITTLLASCGWFVNGRRHTQEVKGLERDNRIKDMDLANRYVDEFKANIAAPLEKEVAKLRRDVLRLTKAIRAIESCEYKEQCPVREEMTRDTL